MDTPRMRLKRAGQSRLSVYDTNKVKSNIARLFQTTIKLLSIRSYTLFFALLCTLYFSPVYAFETLPPQKAAISSGCEYDYPPFCIVEENGRANGFSVELLRAALQVMNRDVSFRNGHWVEVKGMLERGEIDVLPLVGRTPERESIFDFTFPYLSLHGVIVVQKGMTNIHDLSDLKEGRIAVMEGDNAEEFLRRTDLKLNIHTTATFADALSKLSEGSVDAVVIQRLLALRLIKDAGITNLQIVDQHLDGLRQDFCFAVKEGNRETLSILNEGLALVIADGTFNRLQQKWFATPTFQPDNKIIIGVAQNLAPYSFLDKKGQAVGYSVDITKAIAQVMQLDIEVIIAPFGELRQALEKGEIDAMPMYYSENRKTIVDFTSQYGIVHNAIFIEKNSPAINTEEELRGKKIIVINGDIMHDYVLENKITDKLTTVPMETDALKLLASGKYDCALMAKLPGLYWVKKLELKNIRTVGPLMLPSKICYAVTKGNSKLQSILSEGLATLGENGNHILIHDKWLGILIPSGVSKSTVLRYITYAVLPLLLILILVFIWSSMLKRLVIQRTQELSESEESFRTIVENAPVLINSFDKNGKCVLWNKQCQKTFAWTMDEINKHDVPLELFYPDPKVCEKVLKTITTDPDGHFREWNPITKKGKILTIQWANFHLSGDRIFSLGYDITERNEAVEKTRIKDEQLRAIMEGSQDYIWMLDNKFNILYSNQTGSSQSKENVIGISIHSLLPKDKQAESKEHLEKAIKSATFYKYEFSIKTSEGDFTVFENIAVPLRSDGKVVGLTLNSRDITERKKSENEIAKYRENLEELIKERTAELEKSLSDVRRMNDLFLSREIRIKELRDKVSELEEGK